MFVNKRLKGFENRGFWWHPQVGTPTEPRRPYQTKTSVNHVTLKGPIRKPPTPQFLPLPQQAQAHHIQNIGSPSHCSTINGATTIAVNGGDTASNVGVIASIANGGATANTVNGITVSGRT
ncbi:hypothetical protein V8E54_013635 [Elaphomyces granulatus]